MLITNTTSIVQQELMSLCHFVTVLGTFANKSWIFLRGGGGGGGGGGGEGWEERVAKGSTYHFQR